MVQELAKQIADKHLEIAEEEAKLLSCQRSGGRLESVVAAKQHEQRLIKLRAELKGLKALRRGEEWAIRATMGKVIPAAERFAKHGDRGKGKTIRDFGEGDSGMIDPEGIPL